MTTSYCPNKSCPNVAFLQEYEGLNHAYEQQLVRQLAEARLHMNEMQEKITELRSPTETRADGVEVRKARWEEGMRRLAKVLSLRDGQWEVEDVIRQVEALVGGRG